MKSPYTLGHLMSIYEQNYRLLMRLIPDNDIYAEGEIRSDRENEVTLYLYFLERNAYTMTLRLTYFIPDGQGGYRATPDLRVRLYHDAKLAEVYLYNKHGKVDTRQFGILRGDSELAARCKINAFLEKWLAYCVSCGHRFCANPMLEKSL